MEFNITFQIDNSSRKLIALDFKNDYTPIIPMCTLQYCIHKLPVIQDYFHIIC